MQTTNNTQEFDTWELALLKEKENLQNCQRNLKLKSCIDCDKLLDCEIRKTYIKAVYSSMNKGSGGGFEF